jgi:hypothetical protein
LLLRYSKYLIRADDLVVYPCVGNISFFFATFIRLAIPAKKSFRTDRLMLAAAGGEGRTEKLGIALRRKKGRAKMKGLTMVGVILLVLGLLAFVVPIPHKEDHGVKIGDAKIGVQTEHSDRVPPLVAGVLVLAGVVSLAAGSRKSA